ncbi:hypothetical protein [Shewanella algae]|uniref:hypothetical protein n=1 Tax=Shewanella algae TaxID=38313 RepID=UPI00165617E1|nr:hypothetical protein [Shewanella algae]MBC8796336.1 hypothetical protein [Shewanella algae]
MFQLIALLKLPVSVLDGWGLFQLLSSANTAKSAWVCVLVENGYRDRHERELAWRGRLKLLPEKLFYVNLALFKEFIVVLPLANSKISTCIQG